MTEQEIKNYNLQIAKLLTKEPEVLERDLLKAGTLESMNYHNDWNQLMEAYHFVTDKYDIAWKISSKQIEVHNHGNGINIKCEVGEPIICAFKTMGILAEILLQKRNEK